MARHLPASLLVLATFSVVAPVLTHSALAEPTPADSGMSPFQFSGIVNADNVYVRSGSSENDYPVLKLNKGDAMVVVGQKSDWLKVLPPEGAFCLVGKLWVDARADGTIGRVHDDATNVNVRIGSTLNNMLAQVVVQLKAGDEVKIVGTQDEYYKIAPPAGAFVYVNKRFVDMVKRVAVVPGKGQMDVKPADDTTPPTPPTPGPVVDNSGTLPPTPTPPVDEKAPPTPQPPIVIDPTTQPAFVAVAPTTLPSAEARAAFDALEVRFADASNKPIGDQPINELLTGYKMLTSDKQLPEGYAKAVDSRVKALTVRQELFAEYQKSQAEQHALATQQLPAQAEASEIEQRIKDAAVKRYAAVGTLHTSALPYNGQTLYRLTDPSSGRTVVYVVTSDPAVKALEGQFVGVRGAVTDDTSRKIRFIQPTATESIDAGEITRGTVTATLTPPSLIAASAAAQ